MCGACFHTTLSQRTPEGGGAWSARHACTPAPIASAVATGMPSGPGRTAAKRIAAAFCDDEDSEDEDAAEVDAAAVAASRLANAPKAAEAPPDDLLSTLDELAAAAAAASAAAAPPSALNPGPSA